MKFKRLVQLLEAKYSTTSAVAIFNKKGELLILQRSIGEKWSEGWGKWNLPGGGIDPGETPKEAAIREVWEEATIKLEDIEFFKKYELVKPGKQKDLYIFTADVDMPIVKIDHESANWRWITEDQIDLYEFALSEKPIIKTLFKLRS